MKRLLIVIIAGFMGILAAVWIISARVDPVMIPPPPELGGR